MNELENEINKHVHIENEKREIESNPQIVKLKKDIDHVATKISMLDSNIFALKAMLNQSDEEMSLTKEDLMSKLLQRADFVAQREELDEMHEISKKSYGNDFYNYWQLQENYDSKLEEKYNLSKQRNFYLDILNQLKTFCLNKESISETSSELDGMTTIYHKNAHYNQIEALIKKLKKDDSMLSQLDDTICMVSKNLGLSLKLDVLNQK